MSKYRAKKVISPDGVFDSQREYKRWHELKLLEKAGQVKELRRGEPITLIPKVGKNRPTTYRPDFEYLEAVKRSGVTIWNLVTEDCKGMRTEVYKIKRKLLRWRFGIEIRET